MQDLITFLHQGTKFVWYTASATGKHVLTSTWPRYVTASTETSSVTRLMLHHYGRLYAVVACVSRVILQTTQNARGTTTKHGVHRIVSVARHARGSHGRRGHK